MNSDLSPVGTFTPAHTSGPGDFTAEWLRGRRPGTIKGYLSDMSHLARFAGIPGTPEPFERFPKALDGSSVKETDTERAARLEAHRAVQRRAVNTLVAVLIEGGLYQANRLLGQWSASMAESEHSPATINRRLSAVQSALRHARKLGIIEWAPEVDRPASEAYRDTRGPGVEVVAKVLANLRENATDPIGSRDYAIVSLLWLAGLRRAEAASLNVGDVDEAGCRIMLLGKRRTEKSPVEVAPQAIEAITGWLGHRGRRSGALFCQLDRTGKRGRLSPRAIGNVVDRAGRSVGVVGMRAHGIRHTAITEVLNRNGGDVRTAMAFSRHRDLATLQRYIDNLDSGRRDMSSLLADVTHQPINSESPTPAEGDG